MAKTICTLQALPDLGNSNVPDGLAQVGTEYTYGQLRLSSCKPNPNTRTTDRLQRDRPAACVIATSSIIPPLPYHCTFPSKTKFLRF